MLLSWSTSDLDSLAENIAYHNGNYSLSRFLTSYCDVQKYCHDMLGLPDKNALGLSVAADILELDTEQFSNHRALDDSFIAAMCLKRLYHRGAFESYIRNVDKEFLDELFFRSYYLNTEKLNIELLESITFNCPECAARAERISDPKPKGIHCFAEYRCPECKTGFTGRARFKKRLIDVHISKKGAVAK